MSEEKKKSIPIEDGSEKPEEEAADAGKDQETEAEDKRDAEPEIRVDADTYEGEETAEESCVSEENAEEANSKEEEPENKASAEEQESERYMRLMAEFQNFKRRAAKEKADIHAFANERIVNDLLPVLDNFERALSGGADGTEASEGAQRSEEFVNYAKGMELIFEQLKTALEKAGLKEIEALGQDFNPNVHNAVMTESTDEYEDGKISKVMQKGYTLNDRVVRPSMVAVNKK